LKSLVKRHLPHIPEAFLNADHGEELVQPRLLLQVLLQPRRKILPRLDLNVLAGVGEDKLENVV